MEEVWVKCKTCNEWECPCWTSEFKKEVNDFKTFISSEFIKNPHKWVGENANVARKYLQEILKDKEKNKLNFELIGEGFSKEKYHFKLSKRVKVKDHIGYGSLNFFLNLSLGALDENKG